MNLNKSHKNIDMLSIFGSWCGDKKITVKNIVERDMMPIEIMYPGMRVFVEDTYEEFMYTDNNTWTLIEYDYDKL